MGAGEWTRDHKLQFWAIVVGAVIAIAAIVVPLVVTGGGGGEAARVVTNNGQVNVGGTVNNYYAPSSASSAEDFCPDLAPATANTSNEVVRLYLKSASDPDACWGTSTELARTPTNVKFMISYENVGSTVAKNVVARTNLAPDEALVPGTTYVYNSTYPKGRLLAGDVIDTDGYIVGDYAPHAGFYVTYEVTTSGPDRLSCGKTSFRTVGTAYAEGSDQIYNVAVFDLTKQCSSASPTG